MIASASETSSFSSPVRSRPNRMPIALPGSEPRLRLLHGGIGREDPLHLPALAGRGGEDEVQVGDGLAGRVVERRALQHMGRAGGRRMRPLLGPAVARRNEAQLRQPEIGHGARHHADVFGELGFHEDDDRAGHEMFEPNWMDPLP